MLSNVSGLHESVSGGCECPPAAQAIWVQKKADDIARHASVHLWPWSGGIATRRQGPPGKLPSGHLEGLWAFVTKLVPSGSWNVPV